MSPVSTHRVSKEEKGPWERILDGLRDVGHPITESASTSNEPSRRSASKNQSNNVPRLQQEPRADEEPDGVESAHLLQQRALCTNSRTTATWCADHGAERPRQIPKKHKEAFVHVSEDRVDCASATNDK